MALTIKGGGKLYIFSLSILKAPFGGGGATIRISQGILCLPYAEFSLNKYIAISALMKFYVIPTILPPYYFSCKSTVLYVSEQWNHIFVDRAWKLVVSSAAPLAKIGPVKDWPQGRLTY